MALIKEKKNGTIKDQVCADSIKQRYYMDIIMDVSSPTVSLEVLFLALLIDSYKSCEVDILVIPDAFLQP